MSVMETKVLNYRIIIEQDEDGIFVAPVPALQGCYTEGDTFEEAIKNAEDIIKLHVASRKEHGELIDDSNTEFVGIKNISLPYGISSHR